MMVCIDTVCQDVVLLYSAANCPLALKRKQEILKENGGSVPKKPKMDGGVSRATSEEKDTILLKEVSDIPCDITIKQEPQTDEDYFKEANKALTNLSGVPAPVLISTIQSTSVSELPVGVKQEVSESEDTKPPVSLTDADILRKIEEECARVQGGVEKWVYKEASGIPRSRLDGNVETVIQPLSSKPVTDNSVNIDTDSMDDKNIVTQTIPAKSVETASSKIFRKVAGNKEQNENNNTSMDRESPVTTVVKQELDDDSDEGEDGGGDYMVLAEWTDGQLQEAGTSDAEKEARELGSSNGPMIIHPDKAGRLSNGTSRNSR